MPLALSAHHMSFPVRDLQRARAFYEGVLGLRPIPRPDIPIPGAWYAAGPCEVHLIEVPEGIPFSAPGVLNPMERHAAFAVADYDAAVAELRSKGLEVLETSAGIGQLWVTDPDGHIIELIASVTNN